MLQKIIYIKKPHNFITYSRFFFIAANIVIFFDKKSSLQILRDKHIFCTKITCKKISKEINVGKIYVLNFILAKKFISLTIWPIILFHKYVHI